MKLQPFCWWKTAHVSDHCHPLRVGGLLGHLIYSCVLNTWTRALKTGATVYPFSEVLGIGSGIGFGTERDRCPFHRR